MRDSARRAPQIAAAVLAAAILAADPVTAQDPQSLLQKYDCSICHADDEARTGPAFVDVAVRYRGDPKAVAALVALVQKGAHGRGPWNMPPLPQVPDADARSIARYILALDK